MLEKKWILSVPCDLTQWNNSKLDSKKLKENAAFIVLVSSCLMDRFFWTSHIKVLAEMLWASRPRQSRETCSNDKQLTLSRPYNCQVSIINLTRKLHTLSVFLGKEHFSAMPDGISSFETKVATACPAFLQKVRASAFFQPIIHLGTTMCVLLCYAYRRSRICQKTRKLGRKKNFSAANLPAALVVSL